MAENSRLQIHCARRIGTTHSSEKPLLFPHRHPENTEFANITVKDANLKIAENVKNCKGQLTNAVTDEKNADNRFRGTKPRVYWEADFLEVKPEKFRYKYLLVFIDTFSGYSQCCICLCIYIVSFQNHLLWQAIYYMLGYLTSSVNDRACGYCISSNFHCDKEMMQVFLAIKQIHP